MSRIKNLLRRFGGADLLDHVPRPEEDDRLVRGPRVRENLNARLRAIEVEVDVQARRHLRYDKG